jgi:hypothetical protein
LEVFAQFFFKLQITSLNEHRFYKLKLSKGTLFFHPFGGNMRINSGGFAVVVT